MESDDHRKSISELRAERDRLHEMHKDASSRLPDGGANLKHRIARIEELIQQKREQRAKRAGFQRWKTTESREVVDVQMEGEVCALDTVDTGSPLANVSVLLSLPMTPKSKVEPLATIGRPVMTRSKKRMKLEVVELLSDTEMETEESPMPISPPVDHPSDIVRLLANQRIVYPRHGGRGSVQITPSDLARLEPDEFINDTCINLYIKKIEMESKGMERCYIFRTYFYSKLVESTDTSSSSYQKWTKDVNIFDYDYLFVPVYDCSHWSLAIVCFAGRIGEDVTHERLFTPCILHLDSVEQSVGHCTAEVGNVLRSYLQAEWNLKVVQYPPILNSRNLPAKRIAKIPQQHNSADCGLFLLAYLEYFIFDLPDHLDHRRLHELKNKDRPNFLTSRWLKSIHVGLLRKELLHFMYHLYLEQLPDEHPAFDILFQKLSAYDASETPKYKTAARLRQERQTSHLSSAQRRTSTFDNCGHNCRSGGR